MHWEAYFCLGLLAVVFIGLSTNRAPDALLVGAVVIALVTGIISPQEAFAGFANKGMLTVAALYVVAAGLRETGALDRIGELVLGGARQERTVLARMAGSVTVMSAFLNNTPIVAMFIPILGSWCKKHDVAPSRLLLPLSYMCILGGTCTLIGTSTNLVVNGLMMETSQADPTYAETLRPMGLFEMSAVGVPYALVGIAYLYFVGGRLLPNRTDLIDKLSDKSREYLVNMQVESACGLIGKNLEEAGLRHLRGLFLVEVTRGEDVITPVPPDLVLRSGDVLTFTGVINTIVELERIPGLVPLGDGGYETGNVSKRGRIMCEAVISTNSPIVGKSIRDADFRAAYNAAIIAVHRGGERLQGKIGDVVLRPGDTLLMQTGPHFARANRNNPDFLLVSGVENSRPVRSDKAVLSIAFLGVLVTLMATGLMDIVAAAFLVAGLMVFSRCISVADARQSVDVQTLITIAAAFGMATALENSGCVEFISGKVVSNLKGFGPYVVLAAVYILTSIVTETVTNNAAAALLFPFAVAFAGQMGVSPRPFVMAVAFAASASFMTPLGYQTNLMVFGPGGYKFSDFVRVGLPLNLLLLCCAVLLIPRVWPF